MFCAGESAPSPMREKLTANRTYYVRTDGSDSNNGLANTSGGAFLTIQKAMNVIATLDLNGVGVTVQIADGTYTGAAVVPVTVGQASTSGITVRGNSSTPGNVIVSTIGSAFVTSPAARCEVKDLEIRTTTSGYCIEANTASVILWSNIRFGACAAAHVLAVAGGAAQASGNYSIVGSAQNHWVADSAGLIEVANRTVTLTGTPAFSNCFSYTSQAHIRAFGNTYSGSATGARYSASMNGTIQTFGAGATALPGNAAGSTATGGQYG